MHSSLIDDSIIFLFVTWYLDAAAQGADVPRATDITELNRSSWLKVMMRHTRNFRFFGRLGWGT